MILPVLPVTPLNKHVGDRHAVRSVSFGLKRSQTLGLIGPNGAGKFTTVGMVLGLLFGALALWKFERSSAT